MGNLEDIGKETYLQNQGYTWDERYQVYLNKQHWKIFSKEYIEYQPFDILLANLDDEIIPDHWKIYSISETEQDLHNMRIHYGAK